MYPYIVCHLIWSRIPKLCSFISCPNSLFMYRTSGSQCVLMTYSCFVLEPILTLSCFLLFLVL